ncbi:glycosyltransferase family 2 protein [Bifidobacterium thermacidophilum]|uniref:Glycosyltransferase family 2 protein n=1 Tax=Bifidobacterium thermacidophilum TaxID=246618 RepID=A0ABW8KST7_9BIFI
MQQHHQSDKSSLTIIIPCCNEEESLPLLFKRLDQLIASDDCSIICTILFIDDGSRDSTPQEIKQYAGPVRDIILSRNFGKENAMFACFEHVHTDGIIIDADLQDPPELIPQMVDLWRQGYEDVYARQRSRAGESWFKHRTSHTYYRLLQRFTGATIQQDTGDFRLLDRKCIDALRRMDEVDRNSKALFSWIGFRKIEFLYDRDPRAAGKTKWNYRELIRLAIDGITGFATMPLRLAAYCGVLASLAAIIYAIVIIVRTLVRGIDVPGYASTMVVVLLLGGIQLLSLGIIGEYLGRVFTQTKHRPNYLIEEERVSKGEGDDETRQHGLS